MHNANQLSNQIFCLILIVVISYFLFSRKTDLEGKRRKDLAALARKLQLQFNPNSDFKLAEKYSFLNWFRRGDVRYAYNVFQGWYVRYLVIFFDYHFTIITGSNRGGSGGLDYYWSAYIVEMSAKFPDLLISHESLESRIAEALGKPHIAFESAEFSRTFRVRSLDKRFAFDVCHSGMMEFLLANRDLTIEIRGTALAVLFEDWLHPEKVEHNLARLVEIRKLLPNYLFTKS